MKTHPSLRAGGIATLAAARAVARALDLRDLHFYGGIALAMMGGWMLSPAWTMVAGGAVIALVGLFARARGAS